MMNKLKSLSQKYEKNENFYKKTKIFSKKKSRIKDKKKKM